REAVTPLQPLGVPAIRAKAGKGNVHPPVKIQLLRRQPECGRALLIARSFMRAADYFLDYFILRVFNVIRQAGRAQRNGIRAARRLLPPPSFGQNFSFAFWVPRKGEALVIRVGGKIGRKELSERIYPVFLVFI